MLKALRVSSAGEEHEQAGSKGDDDALSSVRTHGHGRAFLREEIIGAASGLECICKALDELGNWFPVALLGGGYSPVSERAVEGVDAFSDAFVFG